jgi:hypothetical protein
MVNKKITILALAAFIAAFGAYKAFSDLAKAFEDLDFEEEEENEF